MLSRIIFLFAAVFIQYTLTFPLPEALECSNHPTAINPYQPERFDNPPPPPPPSPALSNACGHLNAPNTPKRKFRVDVNIGGYLAEGDYDGYKHIMSEENDRNDVRYDNVEEESRVEADEVLMKRGNVREKLGFGKFEIPGVQRKAAVEVNDESEAESEAEPEAGCTYSPDADVNVSGLVEEQEPLAIGEDSEVPEVPTSVGKEEGKGKKQGKGQEEKEENNKKENKKEKSGRRKKPLPGSNGGKSYVIYNGYAIDVDDVTTVPSSTARNKAVKKPRPAFHRSSKNE
jgi:hypothetical protein